jgi:hypothetical protein
MNPYDLRCCGNCDHYGSDDCKKGQKVYENNCCYDESYHYEYPKGNKLYKCWTNKRWEMTENI